MSGEAANLTWTTRRLLAWMTEAFSGKGIDAPRLSAELLLSHVIGCDRLRLYMDADRPASAIERETLRGLVGRALKHEPIQYLVQTAWFFSLPFHVDRRVLIPRPASETIVEHVLQHARNEPGFGGAKAEGGGAAAGEGVFIADICTGSGCLAVALLKNLPGARAVATDISRDALDVAQQNARRHGVEERLELLCGDLFDALLEHPVARQHGSLSYVVSNPPYIPDHEWADVEPNVKDHEPELALRGGKDGLDLVRRVIEAAPALIRPGGLLLVETAASTAEAAAKLAGEHALLEGARVLTDHEGLPRVVVAMRRRG